MEVWIDEKRPDVMSTANVVLALVIHVVCFLGFFLFAHLHFKQKETVIPIDLTVVVNENLDGNEDEPPPPYVDPSPSLPPALPLQDANNTIEENAECAANKSGDAIGHFQIYAISRNQFKQNLGKTSSNYWMGEGLMASSSRQSRNSRN